MWVLVTLWLLADRCSSLETERYGSLVSLGERQALLHCHDQFAHHPWNCSLLPGTKTSPLAIGSKETAFVYGLQSASLAHVVSLACSSGNLTDCSCDLSMQGRTSEEGWRWGGCSDNLVYAFEVSKHFFDDKEMAKQEKNWNARNLMNIHNYKAGRRAVMKGLGLKCRCHGVSGSCSFQTCWKKLPHFEKIARILKNKYQKSEKVSMSRVKRATGRKTLGDTRRLVYLDPSPNYCADNPALGISGTAGRKCSLNKRAADYCRVMCCGRGYKRKLVTKEVQCRCKFHWCCKVECSVCRKRVVEYQCK